MVREPQMSGSGWMAPFMKGIQFCAETLLFQHCFRKHFKSHWYPVLGTSTGHQGHQSS